MRRVTRARKSEKGAEAVEFALMLLPVFGLIFLIVNVAWVIFARACLQEAVRAGVRYAITGQSDASIQALVQQSSFGVIPSGNAGCVTVQYFSPTDLSTPVTTPVGGDVVEISISNVGVRPLAPLLISSAALPLSASASDIMQSPQIGYSRGTALSCP